MNDFILRIGMFALGVILGVEVGEASSKPAPVTHTIAIGDIAGCEKLDLEDMTITVCPKLEKQP